MKRILIVEDDKSIRRELFNLLVSSNYEPVEIDDFSNTYEEIMNIKPDLILLDINIPYVNGECLLQQIRKTSNVPIIMVTSKNTDIDEVLSMSYGADDYITKPYNPTILLLRINNIFKRLENSSDIIKYKGLEINMKKGIIVTDKGELILTKNEMIIFNYLLTHQNKIVTRDELMTDLWNNDEYINDNALTVNISRLRSKLKGIGYEDVIETRKGIGYILL